MRRVCTLCAFCIVLVVAAVLVLLPRSGDQVAEPPPAVSADYVQPCPPQLKGQSQAANSQESMFEAAEQGPGAKRVLVRVMDRATNAPVPGLALVSANAQTRTDQGGEAFVEPEAVATLRPADATWRTAPAGLDDQGVLWVVGRLRVRAYCSDAHGGAPPKKGTTAVVRLVRPVGFSLDERIQDARSERPRDAWLRESGLLRERHTVAVAEQGSVEVLTWEAPSQGVRITIGSATSAVVTIPGSGATVRDLVPIVEVTVPMDEVQYRIAGRVVADEGAPVSDAEVLVVLLRRMDPRDVDPPVLQPEGHTLGIVKRGDEDRALVTNNLAVRTTEDGSFQVGTPVDSEETLLLVHQPGYARGMLRVSQLSRTDTSALELVLSRSRGEPRCLYRYGGKPLGAGTLVVIDALAEPQFHFTLHVDAGGAFATDWLISGREYHLLYEPEEGEGFLSGRVVWRDTTALDFEDLTRARSRLSPATEASIKEN